MVDRLSARETKRLQTRERLLGAAIAEFKRSGMAEADVGAIVAAATLVTVGLAVLALSSGQPVVFIIGVAIWGIAVGAFPPILQTRVMRVSTSAFRPLAGSIVVTVLNLGVAAGATLGGLVLDHGPIAVTLIAVTAAAVGTFALALMRPLNTPHEGTR